MMLFDVVRFAVFALFGIGLGFMTVTNVMAFMVLRRPQHLGFLWWHVTAVSLSFVCIGIVATERVVSKIGTPPGWRSAVVLAGMMLYAAAQIIIFNVERQRLINVQAREVVSATGAFTGV